MAMSSLSFKFVGHSIVDVNTIKPKGICFNNFHSRIRCSEEGQSHPLRQNRFSARASPNPFTWSLWEKIVTTPTFLQESDGSNDNVYIQVKTSPVERFKSIACGLCVVWAVTATCPTFAATSTPRLPPLSNDPNRCERAFVGNTIGQANGVYDKPIDLRSCDFTNEKTNLRGKSLAAALMSDAKFDGADMSEVIMSKAYAVGSSFKGVDFSNAVIDRVNFGKSDMQGAVFKNTVLSGSTFVDANLEGAKFEDTIIGYIDLQKLCTNKTLSDEGRDLLGCR